MSVNHAHYPAISELAEEIVKLVEEASRTENAVLWEAYFVETRASYKNRLVGIINSYWPE